MPVCISLFIPINHLAIVGLSSLAFAVGVYFVFIGLQLRARKQRLLATPTSNVGSVALGLVEVCGAASGPHTMPAPISGTPCFFFRTTAWQQPESKQEWQKIADETQHLPFFIADSTGQLLIQPLGASLDLLCDFREEYDASFFFSNLSPNDKNVSKNNDKNKTDKNKKHEHIPPGVGVFLSRHGIVPTSRLRIEEFLIKPADVLFVTGTLTENSRTQVRPDSTCATPSTGVRDRDLNNNAPCEDSPRQAAPDRVSKPIPAPQIIRLAAGAAASGSQQMTQQAKITAALTRAGIAEPEPWSAAEVPRQAVATRLEEKTERTEEHESSRILVAQTKPSRRQLHVNHVHVNQEHVDKGHVNEVPLDKRYADELPADKLHVSEDQPEPSGFKLNPPVVLMKGADDPTFVISFRSQKEFATALARKSVAMLSGGAAIALLGLALMLTHL